MTNSDGSAAPTLPEITFLARNYAREEDAQRIGHIVYEHLRAISRYIDLERLDGITIAYDYEQALRDLDRGYETSFELVPSADYGRGVAMTPAVIRDGVVKAHILIRGGIVEPIEAVDTPEYFEALYLLAHECAHVEDLKRRDRAFPNVLLRPPPADFMSQWMCKLREGVWEEYAATRTSAPFDPAQLQNLEQPFRAALSAIEPRIETLREEYDGTGDYEKLLLDLTTHHARLAELAAYVLGHMHGAQQSLDDAPALRDALTEHAFRPYFESLEEILGDLWDRRDQWLDFAEFDSISGIVRELVADAGVVVTPLGAGAHIRVVP